MRWIIAVICCCLWLSISCQPYIPGHSYFDTNGHIEYRAGNLPLIISVPHGGYVLPANIPDRSCAACVTVMDAYTQELSLDIKNAIHRLTGCYPHLIINKLHRLKLDANREVEEAAVGQPLAIQAWNAFHDFTQSARHEVINKYGKGLYIDLHGHGHTIQRLELGYLLTVNELISPNNELNTDVLQNRSSIRHLATNNRNGLTHADLLRGTYSLGTMLQNQGFPSVPSTNDPFPKPGEPYFNGGYNTARHGSANGGTLDAVQIECYSLIRFNTTALRAFADSLASVLLQYLQKHYFDTALTIYCNPLTAVSSTTTQGHISVYPNPTCGFVTIQSADIQQVRVYNALGQPVKKLLKSRDESYDISDLPNGWYYLVLINENKTIGQEKILKQCY